MKMEEGRIYIRDPSPRLRAKLKAWDLFQWKAKDEWWEGDAGKETLNQLASLVQLPPPIEAERRRENAIQEAVDRERNRKNVIPLVHYPVRKQLYVHQIRAANMALLTFGVVGPEEET